jgi:hypothetical protein
VKIRLARWTRSQPKALLALWLITGLFVSACAGIGSAVPAIDSAVTAAVALAPAGGPGLQPSDKNVPDA